MLNINQECTESFSLIQMKQNDTIILKISVKEGKIVVSIIDFKTNDSIAQFKFIDTSFNN